MSSYGRSGMNIPPLKTRFSIDFNDSFEMQPLTAPAEGTPSQNVSTNPSAIFHTNEPNLPPDNGEAEEFPLTGVPPALFDQAPGTKIRSTRIPHLGNVIFGSGACALFTFAAYYSYESLISSSPALGKLFFSPSITIFVINVLSQTMSFALARLNSSILDTIRWKLVSGRGGVSMLTFFALSSGTSLYGVFRLTWAWGSHLFWCFLRFACPLLCTIIGAVLTIGIDYRDIYTAGEGFPIYAGLTPINTEFAPLEPSDVISIYFNQWSLGLLTASKFVAGAAPITCDGPNCTAVFLPGGIEAARLFSWNLNSTLLNSTTFANSDVLIISDAPGYQVEYYDVEDYFFPGNSCSTYGLDQGDGLHICVASENDTMYAGNLILTSQLIDSAWTICPTRIYLNHSCANDLSWTQTRDQITTLNAFKRYSTTAYDSRNLSILSVTSLSRPERYAPDPNDYKIIFDKLFGITRTSTANDVTMTAAVIFQTGWYLRLLRDQYRSDRFSPLNFLRSLLTVPIQFTVTAWQSVNATVAAKDPELSLYALPADLKATAAPGQRTYRAVARYPVTVYSFMVGVALLLGCWISLFIFVISKPAIVPNTSHFPDVDTGSKSGYPPDQTNKPVLDYSSALRACGLANAESGKIVRAGKHIVLRVLEMNGSTAGKKLLILAADDDKEGLKQFDALSTENRY